MSELSNKQMSENTKRQLSSLLNFESLHNIRDLGGMKTTSGKTIKEGCFIRCGHLSDTSAASSKGAVLWHCTAGKDRAGIASVIIEEILGVSREDIIEDYLSTNTYLEADIQFLTNFVKEQAGIESTMADEALRYLFGADKDYIESYYKAIEERYGDFGNFIREGLGLSETDITALSDFALKM